MYIDLGVFMNLKKKSTTLCDGGNRLFTTTTVSTLGKAIAGVLQHREETKNLKASVSVKDYGNHFQNLDNELLGIKGLAEDEVRKLVDAYAKL
ncbi:hypothetical protein F4775DRAFT_606700 [Biscogniauxia sp. FL1348]|nr:hypothetical protein F4775DRAFT_606700 [Biscogniauxia sp. FL1348]